MTINSRTKGAGAELEFSNIVFQWVGVRLIRNLEQSRSGGHDLIVHADEVGPVADSFRSLAIEVKRHAKAPPAQVKVWWQQAREQAELNRLHPVLAYRANRADWQVVTPLYLINPALDQDVSLDCACSMSVIGFCSVIGISAHSNCIKPK
jgi:hypothetical protein